MVNAPTNAEVAFWLICVIIAIILVVIGLVSWHDPRNDDPYRYCPKEEEEE